MQKYWDEQVFTVVSDEEDCDCDTKHQLEYYQAQCRFHLGMEQGGSKISISGSSLSHSL